MKALSLGQVRRCEAGARPRCRCRCGGALHGARRARLPEYFEQLPETDPHRITERSRQLTLPPPFALEEVAS